MSGLVRRPIKAHKGTIVDGQIVYEKDDVESTTSTPKESAPVATPVTTEPAPAVSTPALAVTPPPPPVPTTQQPVQQTVQQPAPQPIPPPSPPPQPVAQPVETPEQAQQVANTFVPENVKTAPKQVSGLVATPTRAVETDAQKEKAKKEILQTIKEKFPKQYEAMLRERAKIMSKRQRESAKRLRQAAAIQSPKRLPQPYRPTQEEQKEFMDLDRLVRDTPEYKLLQKEAREFTNIQQKELGPYQRKVGEAARQFGPQSQEFKNAVESMQFQQRLFAKQYKPTLQRLNKLQNDINNSDAAKNFREARDRIFKRNKIQENVPSQFNKGGMSMEQQMSLFEEGGMKDDGLNIDPVSGNDIPPGSLAKEVRDDIPAQLSDGEYVVPADVVQYYGVKFFEDLRMEAKSGLAQMEATGRIGGEPMAVDMTMIAFGQKDKDKKEKKATGGVVGFDNGGVSADQKAIDASQPKFNPQDYSVLGFTPASPIYQTGQGQPQQNKTTMTYYHGQTGESKVITFVNGVVTPASDLQFTQPPWSLNKPTQTQQEVAKDRDDSGGKKSTEPEVPQYLKDVDFTTWKGNNFTGEATNALGRDMGEKFFGAFSMLALGPAGLLVNEMIDIDGIAKATIMEQAARAGGYIDEADAINKQISDHLENESTFATRNFLKTKIGQSVFNGAVTRIKDALNKSNQTWSQIGKTTTTGDGKNKIKSGATVSDDDFYSGTKRSPGYEDRQKSAVATGTATKKDAAGTTAISRSAEGMSKQDSRRSTEQAGMAGQDTTSLAAGKFGGNKGGLLKRPKRKNKK